MTHNLDIYGSEVTNLADIAFIKHIYDGSPYLKTGMEQRPDDVILMLKGGKKAAEEHIEAIFKEAETSYKTDWPEAVLMAYLRKLKNRLSIFIGLCDCKAYWKLEKMTAYLSRLADFCVTKTLEHLLYNACKKGDIPMPPLNKKDEKPNYLAHSGMVILAMGKLGGYELNYSSDIDLIIFYDVSRFKNLDQEKKWRLPKIYAQIARRLTHIMAHKSKDGYVFRTDLRLRPDPSSTPPAVSIEAAEAYYGSLAQNWERAAMIKARPIASDSIVTQSLMSMLNPWIWRRNLDFAAIQDIHSIKRQINANINMPMKVGAGQNVKLGRGGIREIEFFIATQQLIYGGKNPKLRIVATAKALDALAKAGLITDTAAKELQVSYRYLRRVEHYIQMTHDRQSHSLPDDEEGCIKLAYFLGYENNTDFYDELTEMLMKVEKHYAQLFAESASLAASKNTEIFGNLVFTGSEDDPDTLRTLSMLGYREPSQITEIVRNWHKGRYRALRHDRARQILTEIMPHLLQVFGQMPQADTALIAFDRFLSCLSMGIPFLSLLSSRPEMLKILAQILGSAPALAEALSTQPERFDVLIHYKAKVGKNLFDRKNAEKELAVQSKNPDNYEKLLDTVRVWASEQRFLVGLDILFGTANIFSCCHAYTKIADLAIKALYPACLAEFYKKHGDFGAESVQIAILALGKYGGKELLSGSDLDLIIIYEHDKNDDNAGDMSNGDKPLGVQTYYNRLAQRLGTAISAPTAEGRLYDVDMRLRPHGGAGALAVSIENFIEYQQEEAWHWEHLALTRARFIIGPQKLGDKINIEIKNILARKRSHKELKKAVAEMRERIALNHKAKNIWQIKYWQGGIVDLEFIVQFLYIEHAHLFSKAQTSVEMRGMIDILHRNKIIASKDAVILHEALELWLSLSALSRLMGAASFGVIKDNASLQQTFIKTLKKTKAVQKNAENNASNLLEFSDILNILLDKSKEISGLFRKIIKDDK